MVRDPKDLRYAKLDDDHVPESLFLAVHRFAEWAGIYLDGRKIGEPGVLQYDGETIGVGDQTISNIIHDIAHFVAAPDWRRQHPDWGLGAGTDEYSYFTNTDHNAPARYGTDDEIQEQEEIASLFGICVEVHLGLGCDTLNDHNWGRGIYAAWHGLGEFFASLKKLQRIGLISDDCGRPACMDYIL